MFQSPALITVASIASFLITSSTSPKTSCEAFAYQQPQHHRFPDHMKTLCNNRHRFSSCLQMASTPVTDTDMETEETEENSEQTTPHQLPEPDKHGIYTLTGKDDHIAFLEENKQKITIIKFYAPWCRACKGLEPKFIQVARDKKYAKLPLAFAQISVQHNKDYIKSLGILALPSIHIYVGEEGLVENFPCGPSKVPILKKKIAQVVNSRVDAKTFTLKPYDAAKREKEAEACAERSIDAATGKKTKLSVGDVVVSEETMKFLRTEIPYFVDFTEEEFQTLMSKSTYSTFEPGAVIMKQGMPGTKFYVIDEGEVEIFVKGAFEDPLTTPSGYLGAVVNRFTKHEFFGERSLITGQTRAASIRAADKTRCFTFEMKDIPESSVLSGKARPSEQRLKEINDKYSTDFYNIELIDKQFKEANMANQIKGSPNRAQEEQSAIKADDNILSLLVRFKLLRHASRCFDYILRTNPNWGDAGDTYRRSLLVSKLSPGQQAEFRDVFDMIDTSNDGLISVLELKSVLGAINDKYTDEQLMEMINKADPSVNGNTEISLDEFMGVMAEAEFYYLFKETFATLDKENTGFVQARKLDQVLCGLRDLISDDRKSIIDVDDQDMLIDYENFSRMMIGTL